jgi:hypothetical protein
MENERKRVSGLLELLNWDAKHPDNPRLPSLWAIRAIHGKGGEPISEAARLAIRRLEILKQATPRMRALLKQRLLNGEDLLRTATSEKLARGREKSREIAGPYRNAARLLLIWIDSWLRSGSDSQKWADQNPKIAQGFLRSRRSYAGRAAIDAFAAIIHSPLAQSLFQCKKCRRFELNTSGRLCRVYCSRSCGWRTTATVAVYSARKREKQEKLRRVKKVLKKWRGGSDWKKWAAERADVTPNWISYALRRGELAPPKKAVDNLAR